MAILVHYLLVYDHAAGMLIDEKTYTDPDEAIAAYAATEREHHFKDKIEVVLIGAESVEALRVTHAHYFEHIDPLHLTGSYERRSAAKHLPA